MIVVPTHSMKCVFPSREIALESFHEEIRWLHSKLVDNENITMYCPFAEISRSEVLPSSWTRIETPESDIKIDPDIIRGDIHTTDSESSRMELLRRYYTNQHFMATSRFVIIRVMCIVA